MALNRDDKLQKMGIERLSDLSDEQVDILYRDSNRKDAMEKAKNYDTSHREPATSERYQVALEFINGILLNLGKKKVDSLLEFKNINREDFFKKENVEMFNRLLPKLLTHFDKTKMGWYRKHTINHYILSFFRCMVRDLGYRFEIYKKNKNTNKIAKTYSFYSII